MNNTENFTFAEATPTEKENSKLITRDKAIAVLTKLINSNILSPDIEEDVYDILQVIENEKIGYHFWGADKKEYMKLFTAVRSDLITDEHRKECQEISDKYSYAPSDHEAAEIEANIDECYSEDEDWEDK
jgi:hypothetical protein